MGKPVLKELVKGVLLQKESGQVNLADASVLEGKYVALFFYRMDSSACQEIAYKLKRTYLKLVTTGQPFEVLLVATDPSQAPEALMRDFASNHPWVAVPFGETARCRALRKAYRVAGVPKIIMVSPEGEVLSRQVLKSVLVDPEGEDFPWSQPPDASCCCI
mmetsp:Transcript_27584/g.70271  ORF Transcript_27584/g.70271 Transcript_27584/m.70271 type:complete len:161 (-) Transcript_27584:382-864(-)